jgi:death-on-curing protein
VSDPIFLSVEQVIGIHQQAVQRFGGLSGVRDEGLLESAALQPRHVYWYGRGDLFEIAAAYCFHIAENQPFLDGNKRTAISTALAFLRINGVKQDYDPGALYDAMIAIAEKRMTRAQLAELFRSSSAGPG